MEAIKRPGKSPDQMGGIMTALGSVTAFYAGGESSIFPGSAICLAHSPFHFDLCVIPSALRLSGQLADHVPHTTSSQSIVPPSLG
jgi:hypothetical protein